MKKFIACILGLMFILAVPSVNGQIGKLIKREAEKKTGEAIGNVLRKKKKPSETEKKENTENTEKEEKETQTGEKKGQEQGNKPENKLSWAKYDFVPGDEVIFEDNLEGEENGEFPSRWDLVRGNVEIARLNGENVIMFRDGQPAVIPYFKDAGADYLPEVFTVEMDLYYPGSGTFEIHLYDRKNQRSGSTTGYTSVNISGNEMIFGQARSRYPAKTLPEARWMHIAIAYTRGKLKAYMDDTRLINLPRIDFDPKGITLYTYHASNENLFYVKNIRIAKGGVKYYDRMMQDGKIIATGIRFESGKAEILPESMGVINKIYALMNEHPGIRISVEGHTDNVGDETMNQTLSEKRAESVKNKLISMGIDASRLSSKGWGETKPIADNATPEGRANNRRVEFVKM